MTSREYIKRVGGQIKLNYFFLIKVLITITSKKFHFDRTRGPRPLKRKCIRKRYFQQIRYSKTRPIACSYELAQREYNSPCRFLRQTPVSLWRILVTNLLTSADDTLSNKNNQVYFNDKREGKDKKLLIILHSPFKQQKKHAKRLLSFSQSL